ncbi:glucosaminidase domain-containing protein [Rhizobacter sp. P5_C2]
MAAFVCGDQIRLSSYFTPGTATCLVAFPELPDQVLMLTAGHVVVSSQAQPGNVILDNATGEALGTLFSWTDIDGSPTSDAALIWVDPAKVSTMIRGMTIPKGINPQPAKGDVVRIMPAQGGSQPRIATIKAVGQNLNLQSGGPGWTENPILPYQGQILTDHMITEGGDSGALVLDMQDRAVGMVVAGSLDNGTIITPIAAILQNKAWRGMTLGLLSSIPDSAVAPPQLAPAVDTTDNAPAPTPIHDPVPEPVAKPVLAPAPVQQDTTVTDYAVVDPDSLSGMKFEPTSPEEFIRLLTAAALDCMQHSQVPASFTIAQAALESSWGKSKLSTEARNLFGVKADKSWKGETVTMYTREFVNDQPVMEEARWRKYPDLQSCIDDHARFFHDNKRYKDCFLNTDGAGFAAAVHLAGYATDANYANKLISIIKKRNLDHLDQVAQPS